MYDIWYIFFSYTSERNNHQNVSGFASYHLFMFSAAVGGMTNIGWMGLSLSASSNTLSVTSCRLPGSFPEAVEEVMGASFQENAAERERVIEEEL